MIKTVRDLATTLVVATAALTGSAGSAFAVPSGDPFTLNCGAVGTFRVVTPPGHGSFTPAFDLDGGRVFIPHSFGAFEATVTHPDGTQETFTEPPQVQGSGKQKADLSCSYTFTGSDPDGTQFSGSGTVTGQLAGR